MIDLGMRLKDDEMIEFLETFDLEVVYEFDRLHEGTDDSYTVESEELSLELLFDADQHCTTIFLHDPPSALERGLVSFPDLRSAAEIRAYARDHSLVLREGANWLRCDGPERCVHYKFEGEEVDMVTLMTRAVAP